MILKDLVTIVTPLLLKRLDNFVIPSMKFQSRLWSLDVPEFDIQVSNVLPKSLKIKVYNLKKDYTRFGYPFRSQETEHALQKSLR